MMGYGLNGSFGWLGYGTGIIVHLAFMLLIILSVVYLFKAVFRSSGSSGTSNSLEILKQRYAKGEMTDDEYRRMKQELA